VHARVAQAGYARVSPGCPVVGPNAASRTTRGRPETFLSQPLPNAGGGPCFAGHLSRQTLRPNSEGTMRSPNQWTSRLLSAQVAGSSPAGAPGRSQFRHGASKRADRRFESCSGYWSVLLPTNPSTRATALEPLPSAPPAHETKALKLTLRGGWEIAVFRPPPRSRVAVHHAPFPPGW
jgi:hypothetical protein